MRRALLGRSCESRLPTAVARSRRSGIAVLLRPPGRRRGLRAGAALLGLLVRLLLLRPTVDRPAARHVLQQPDLDQALGVDDAAVQPGDGLTGDEPVGAVLSGVGEPTAVHERGPVSFLQLEEGQDLGVIRQRRVEADPRQAHAVCFLCWYRALEYARCRSARSNGSCCFFGMTWPAWTAAARMPALLRSARRCRAVVAPQMPMTACSIA